jgi:O-antigen ligase
VFAITLAHPSATRIHTWPWAPTGTVLWLLPVALAIARWLQSPIWRVPAFPLAGGLALLAFATVASAWSSPFAESSLAQTWPTLGGIAFFFLLHDFLASKPVAERDAAAKRIGWLLAFAGALTVIVSLIGWRLVEGPAYRDTRNTVPFGHSNYTAGLIVLIFPWLVRQVWSSRALARSIWAIALAAALVALIGTGSRGGVLAVGAVFIAAACALLVFARWPARQKWMLIAAAIAAAAISILANQRLRDFVLHRTWTEGARESNRQRSAMLAAGWQLGRERPLLGWGPGTVPLAYPRLRGRLDGGADDVLQLHNTPVQLWATLGAGGVGALALILWGVAGSCVAGARAAGSRSPETRASSTTALTAAASLGGYGLFALTDHQFDLPVIVAISATGLALVTSRDSHRVCRVPSAIRVLVAGACALLLCGPVAARLRDLRARYAYEQALRAFDAGAEIDFLAAMDRAARLMPKDAYLQHQAAASVLRQRDRTNDPQERLALTRDAVTRLEASLASGAFEEFAHFNGGWLRLDLNDPAGAASHFLAAARLSPAKSGVYFGLGLALKLSGHPREATRAFALEWLDDPRSLTSPAWEVPALQALRPAVEAEALSLLDELARVDPSTAENGEWIRWWLRAPAGAPPPDGFNAESAAFSAAWPTISKRAPVSAASNPAWAVLYGAWRDEPRPASFLPLAAGNHAFAEALARRAQRHRDAFSEFLRAGTEDEAAVLRTLQHQRAGYSVLALHPDGPPLTDLFIVQENRVIADFASGLFPPKGWIPAPLLIALLPTLETATARH